MAAFAKYCLNIPFSFLPLLCAWLSGVVPCPSLHFLPLNNDGPPNAPRPPEEKKCPLKGCRCYGRRFSFPFSRSRFLFFLFSFSRAKDPRPVQFRKQARA